MNQSLSQTDVVNLIIQTINTLFSDVFSSIDNNIYSSMDSLVFINSSVIKDSYFENLLSSKGLIYIANSLLLAFSLYYIARLYCSNYVESYVEKPYQFIFKLILLSFFINFSYFICEQLININFLVSSSIQDIGKSIIGKDISFSMLVSILNENISINYSNSIDLFTFEGIIKSITSTGLLGLLLSYSVRYILIQFFVLTSPIILLTLLNSSTSWIFKSWCKCFFSLLFLQIFVPFILIVVFCIDPTNRILFVGAIYALTKLNSYIREIFGGISVDFSSNFSNTLSAFKR